MSTEAIGGTEPEQHSEPMAEAGCEDKIDRIVQGTAHAGFAKLRSRAMQEKHDATEMGWRYHRDGKRKKCNQWLVRARAFEDVLAWLNELEADAKDETR